MADTLTEIYNSTALGPTQMDDGEETILTTNATTSYVVKDMNVQNTSALSGTYLELNGFNVGSVNANATGSLVIPPNSTLKIKSTDYPYSFYKESLQLYTPQNHLLVSDTYVNPNDGTRIFAGMTKTTTAYSSMSEAVRAYRKVIGGNEYLYWHTHDNNSAQAMHWYDPTANNHNQFEYANYQAMGFYDHPTKGFLALRLDGTTLRYKDLDTNPVTTGGINTNDSPFGTSSKTNSYNPYPTSSYPRGFVAHDFFWYVPSSSYSDQIHGIDLITGQHHKFTLSASLTLSGNNSFIVALRSSDDKFIFYKQRNSTTLEVNVSDVTKSSLASANSTTLNTHTTTGLSDITGLTVDISPVGGAQMGYDTFGNCIFQHGSTNDLVTVQPDGTIVSTEIDSYLIEGATYTSDGKLHVKESVTISSAEAASVGFVAPTFGVQLLGIKSET
jgi:hypothetical protein